MISISTDPIVPRDAGVNVLCEPLGLKARRALIVSPDRTMVKRCQDVALAHGYSVVVANCGVDALTAARQSPPDLVLLDLELRDVHGLEWVGWMRSTAALKSIPVIAATAFGSDPTDPRALQCGVLAVLRKPLRTAELDHWLAQVAE